MFDTKFDRHSSRMYNISPYVVVPEEKAVTFDDLSTDQKLILNSLGGPRDPQARSIDFKFSENRLGLTYHQAIKAINGLVRLGLAKKRNYLQTFADGKQMRVTSYWLNNQGVEIRDTSPGALPAGCAGLLYSWVNCPQ